VGRLFGLDGFFLLVESGGSLTYSTTEQLLRLFLVMTLNPTYLEPIQQVFSLMLPEGISARFKTDEILTADIKSRYEAYAIGITNEFLDPDEVRRIEGRAPFDQTTRANMAARRTQPVEEVINATG
jgi:phage portal protein BeeE